MTDIKEASAKFWTEFQADFRVLKNDVSSASQDAATLANLRKGVMALEKRVMDASIFLPAYDQRQCNIQIQEISEKLNSMSKPRAKFSFGSGRTRAGGAVASIAQSIKDVAAAKENAVTKSANVEEDASSILNGTRIVGVRSAYISRNGPLTDGHDFHLHDIDDCVVDLRSETHISAIHARHIKNSIIISGVVSGSVLMDDINNCIFVAACRQVRIHNSTSTHAILRLPSSPIIEDCTRMLFSPCPFALLNPRASTDILTDSNQSSVAIQLMQKVGFETNETSNRWSHVEDFNWLKKQASPNWSIFKGKLISEVSASLKENLSEQGSDATKDSIQGALEELGPWVQRNFSPKQPFESAAFVTDTLDNTSINALKCLLKA